MNKPLLYIVDHRVLDPIAYRVVTPLSLDEFVDQQIKLGDRPYSPAALPDGFTILSLRALVEGVTPYNILVNHTRCCQFTYIPLGELADHRQADRLRSFLVQHEMPFLS